MDKADVVIKSNAVFTGDGLEPFKGGVAVRGDDQDVIAVQTLQGLRQGGDAAAAVAVVAGRRR